MKGMLNKKTLTLVSLLLFLTLLVGCFPLINQSPIITSTPITLAEVNELYTYEVEATDPDGDPLTYSLEVKPSGMTITSATGLIKWTPTAKGDYPVIVKVSDGTLDITQSFTIVVSEAEEPGWTPIITSTPITTATIGVLYTYDVNATDPNDDTLTYSLTTYPSGMAINSATGLIMWTPTAEGNYVVVVEVSDGVLSDTQGFTIVVSELPAVNQAPVIYSTPATTVTVGEKYTYTIKATDPDGDTITYSLVSGPTGMTFNGVATISWIPVLGQVGNNGVTVKASDGKLSTPQSFTITVSAVEPEPEPEIVLTGIVIDPKTMTLFVGESEAIKSVTATYEIRGYEIPIALGECDYVSNPTGVVTISDVGLVEAIAYGITTITVNYEDETDTVVVTVIGPVQNINTNGYYDTIQGAINTASDGDTIKVMAGTYNEAVSIDKQLTLLGAQYDVDPTVEGARIDESAESIIDAGSLSAVVTITADSVSLNGFTIKNGGGPAPSHLRGGVVLSGTLVFGCTISNNKIIENLRDGIDSCSSGSGVSVFENNVISNNGYGAVFLLRNEGGDIFRNNVISDNADSGWTGQIGIQSSDNIVEYNTINGDTFSGIMVMGSLADIRENNILRGNIINRGESGPGFSSYGIGIAQTKNTLIEDNIIHNNVGGVGVFQDVDTTSLRGNDIQGNEWGIKVGSTYGDTKNTTIEENDVLNNGVGIWIRATTIAASTTHINQNNIVDNVEYGVLNETATLVDAENNWWGDADGPYHLTTNPNGLGNEVSDNVDYVPYSDSSH